ncbi:MAG: glycosyltransferase [Chloroflexota bacterium]
MRVTLISKAAVVGAYQTKFEELAAHADIELTVVTPPCWREGGHRIELERAHTRGYELVVAPTALNGRFHVHFYPTLPAILRRSLPDLCHIDEEPYNLATYLAAQAARRQGARVVFYTWQNLLRRYPFPFGAMERAVYRLARGAIAGNQAAANVLRGKGYAGPVVVIPQFGVDPQLFRPISPETPRPFTIGFAGRLVEEKGLRVLADAVCALPGEWRLVLCGHGPLHGELARRFAAAGLAERVTLAGYVSSREMPRYLNAMDVMVLPSLTRPNWKEQFGRVLLEAMACEVPAVGSDSGEIPNVIGEGGLIFREGDASALCAHLAALRDEPGVRHALGRAGRLRVLARYTQAQIAAQTAEFYRAVCRD